MIISIRARGARGRRARPLLGTLLGSALAFFASCRTRLPEEVFYTGVSQAGAPATNGGSPGTGGSAPTAGTTDEPGGSPGDGDAGAAGAGTDEFPPDPTLDCGPAPVSTEAFSRSALRGAAAACAAWHFCQFESEALALESRLEQHREAASERSLERVQEAWKSAMAAWSRVESFQFGPFSSRATSAGKDSYRGQGLREFIYAWPSGARCRVEDQIVGRGYETNMASVPISGRGLYALEYSLFYTGSDTACAQATATAKTWAELDEAELAELKLAYASALVKDVRERAHDLVLAFTPEGDDFQREFRDAVGYPNEQEAMNVLAWSLIYVEREVKDWKLGIPAGYTLTSPVTEAESPYALIGTEAVRANLRGFRGIFQGCGPDGEGLGFDDWLAEAGHAELAEEILNAWKDAQAAADAFGPLASASQSDARALYAAVKGVTDLLKSDLFGAGSPLNLKLPASVASDTD